MFPNGEVSNLRDAMEEKYDAYFRVQQKVQFERCSEGYFVEEEGPMEIVDYTYYRAM
jgi:arylsulfatase